MEMVPSAEVMSVGPSEMETTISTEALTTAVPKELPVDIFRADEELIEPQRTLPVRPGHLWCGGAVDGKDGTSPVPVVLDPDDHLLSLLKTQHLEILERFNGLHESLQILTRMSFHDRQSHSPQHAGVACSAKKMCSMTPQVEDDPAESPGRTKSVKPPVLKNPEPPFRPSFTPNLFSSFEQFEMSLKRVAARADSAHRKRKFASLRHTDMSERPRPPGCVKRIVRHAGFDFFFAFVVLTNSIFIGVEVQLGLENQGARPLAIYIFQYAYTFLFSLELAMRLWADCRYFLCSEEWMWTWLDIFIVISSIWELIVDILYVWSGNEASEPERLAGFINLKALRVIRITRIVKAVRLMRIFRFVMALRTLITSILHTLQSLFWALALLVLIVYVFAVLFVQAVQDHILDPDNPALPEREMIATQRYFSSLPDTMLSLFMSIAGGASWEDVQAPLKAISTVWVFFFLFFVSFTYFAVSRQVLNVVTGVFCQSAIDSAQNDHATVVQSILANKQMHVNKIRNLFTRFDQQETGVITFAMLEEKLDAPEVREYFETLGLDVWDAWTFFKLLDLDAGGAISIEEFLMGCLRLRGPARAIDVEKMIYDQSWLIRSQGKFTTYMEGEMSNLKESLNLLTGMHLTRSSSLKRSESPDDSQELSAWHSGVS